ncbi:MAG: Gfo/Idh/MocA family oxidoreductase [Phenylobacterium sp.]|uniref:Gfo/Idh/MocA family protein n=1 Tax=Phenylobacterium sp. TaxID=1871053 RepID=UPI001A606900|nr:Gfo/Idh/MocA family oxidoreductase [Phenylobacterium sp.]MBL8771559.1 Gfo/Idh/MocA family oxidoreductase [Phenylobacterium sp.]
MSGRVLRIGVAGLSRGFDLTRPTLQADARVAVVAAADPRPEARAAFQAEFGAPAYPTAEAMFEDPDVEVVYIATPHETHADLAVAAARQGKHILVEKPMALSLADCARMRSAADAAGVSLVVGPSHGFDAPVAWAGDFIASGVVGAPRMVTSVTFTDFIYRPRRPAELDTRQGGGVVFSQAAHQVDVARRLVGDRVVAVRATTGIWDPARPTEGAYQAFLTFAGGASAALTYSGYGRYDSNALMGGIGETGEAVDVDAYAAARSRLGAAPEAELKSSRAYGAAASAKGAPAGHEHFGFVLASCERADVRPTARGVEIYSETSRRTVDLPLGPAGRKRVIDELWTAVVKQAPVIHDGLWGAENLAVCLAILRASAEGREVEVDALESGE